MTAPGVFARFAVVLCILLGAIPILGLLIVAASAGTHQPVFVTQAAATQLMANLSSLTQESAFRVAVSSSLVTAFFAACGACALAWPLTLTLKLLLGNRRRWAVLWIAIGALFSSSHLKAFALSVALVRLDESGLSGNKTIAYSQAATVFYLAIATAPYSVILCALGLERASDASRICATNLGVSTPRFVGRLLLPAARTTLVASFVCALVIALGDPVAPAVVGGGTIPNLPAWAVDQYRISAVPRLATVALLQALLSVVLFCLAGFYALREVSR